MILLLPAERGIGAIALDSSGKVFVTASSRSRSTNSHSQDYVTLAYSSAGVALWTNCYNVSAAIDVAQPPVVAVDGTGHVFVTGASYVGTNGVFDYATVAYSGAGMPLWTNHYNGPGNNEDVANSVAVDLAVTCSWRAFPSAAPDVTAWRRWRTRELACRCGPTASSHWTLTA